MAIRGLDYSTGPPKGAAIKAAGYEFVIRYVSTPGHRKNISRTEYADMVRNNVAVAIVFERSAGRALQGRAAGRVDARTARDQASSVGFPAARPIYFAVDVDITTKEQFARVDEYLRGAAEIVGAGLVGVYGEYDIIEHCRSTQTAAWTWQTMAWSLGAVSPNAHLIQQLGSVTIDGVICDVNIAQHDDFGQWPLINSEGDDEVAVHQLIEAGSKGNLGCSHIKGPKKLTAFCDSFEVTGGNVRTAACVRDDDGKIAWVPIFKTDDKDDPYRWWLSKGFFTLGLPDNTVGVSIEVEANMKYPVDWCIAPA